jgi:O-antigen biosynthesis protein
VLDLERGLPEDRADAVLCLGVFSCIHDDSVWRATLGQFAQMVPPGGTLVLRESVVTGVARRVRHPNGYYACYRSRADYVAAVTACGFRELDRVQLFALPNGLENYLWVFRRTLARVEEAETPHPAEAPHAELALVST